MNKIPRIMIAGTNSGCGKTTVVCGILSALKQMKVAAAACKCGPDYIDPMFHSQIFGIPSQNLDLFFSTKEQVSYLCAKNGRNADITVMEGVMGYYDGMQMDDTKASAYDLAKQTDTPVVLVVNASGMALSVLAIIKGFLEFQTDNTVRGVILNGVSQMTGKMLTEIIERELDIKVYGCIPTMTDFQLSSRHLGLITPHELTDLSNDLMKLGEQFLKVVDMEGLIDLANQVSPLSNNLPEEWKEDLEKPVGKGLRIGVGMDKAFCFYYKENLELLQDYGCEIVPFSPLEDKTLPENLDALLLGGGYPELYANELSKNETMKKSLKKAVEEGLPTLAECGGFMYLHESIEDDKGRMLPMVGVIKGKATNQHRLVRFGYINVKKQEENAYLLAGETIKGHEFHYWDSDNNGTVFLAEKANGSRSWSCGHGKNNLMAFDEEAYKKIKRHKEIRKDKHFETYECYTGSSKLRIPKQRTVLLDCMSNLVANEMFSENGAKDLTVEEVVCGIPIYHKGKEHII